MPRHCPGRVVSDSATMPATEAGARDRLPRALAHGHAVEKRRSGIERLVDARGAVSQRGAPRKARRCESRAGDALTDQHVCLARPPIVVAKCAELPLHINRGRGERGKLFHGAKRSSAKMPGS